MKKHLIMLAALIGLSFMLSGCGGANLTPEVTQKLRCTQQEICTISSLEKDKN
jgi:hypothetical protein